MASLANEIAAEINALRPRNTPNMRAVRRQYTARLKGHSKDEVMAVARALLKTEKLRWIAYELVMSHREAFSGLTRKEIEELGQGIASWQAVDTFSIYIAGPSWREGRLTDSTLRRWAKSKDLWWRRAALVATVPLNLKSRGGKGDTSRTLTICEMLLDDHEDMVVKAMSWALRELSERDPKAVKAFVSMHKHRLAARVRREVRNKLETGLKNPKA